MAHAAISVPRASIRVASSVFPNRRLRVLGSLTPASASKGRRLFVERARSPVSPATPSTASRVPVNDALPLAGLRRGRRGASRRVTAAVVAGGVRRRPPPPPPFHSLTGRTRLRLGLAKIDNPATSC